MNWPSNSGGLMPLGDLWSLTTCDNLGDMWAVDDRGNAWHYTGSWTQNVVAAGQVLFGISCANGNLFAVGGNGASAFAAVRPKGSIQWTTTPLAGFPSGLAPNGNTGAYLQRCGGSAPTAPWRSGPAAPSSAT